MRKNSKWGSEEPEKNKKRGRLRVQNHADFYFQNGPDCKETPNLTKIHATVLKFKEFFFG